MVVVAIALASFFVFLMGFSKRRHDWKPLVIGLFALGIGLLGGAWAMLDGCCLVASFSGGNLADLAESASIALRPIIAGLGAALLGGLFTVILRWRSQKGLGGETPPVPRPQTPDPRNLNPRLR